MKIAEEMQFHPTKGTTTTLGAGGRAVLLAFDRGVPLGVGCSFWTASGLWRGDIGSSLLGVGCEERGVLPIAERGPCGAGASKFLGKSRSGTGFASFLSCSCMCFSGSTTSAIAGRELLPVLGSANALHLHRHVNACAHGRCVFA